MSRYSIEIIAYPAVRPLWAKAKVIGLAGGRMLIEVPTEPIEESCEKKEKKSPTSDIARLSRAKEKDE